MSVICRDKFRILLVCGVPWKFPRSEKVEGHCSRKCSSLMSGLCKLNPSIPDPRYSPAARCGEGAGPGSEEEAVFAVCMHVLNNS